MPLGKSNKRTRRTAARRADVARAIARARARLSRVQTSAHPQRGRPLRCRRTTLPSPLNGRGMRSRKGRRFEPCLRYKRRLSGEVGKRGALKSRFAYFASHATDANRVGVEETARSEAERARGADDEKDGGGASGERGRGDGGRTGRIPTSDSNVTRTVGRRKASPEDENICGGLDQGRFGFFLACLLSAARSPAAPAGPPTWPSSPHAHLPSCFRDAFRASYRRFGGPRLEEGLVGSRERGCVSSPAQGWAKPHPP